MTLLRSLMVLACAAGAIGPSATAEAASIVTQSPCTSGPSSSCVFFDFNDVIPTIRTFTVNTGTGPRTVEFTFHGSLYCGNFGGGTIADKVVIW